MDSNDKNINIKVRDINPAGRHPEDILSNLCNKTLLTADKFCKILTQLRDSNTKEYKRCRYPQMWPNVYGIEEDYI